MINLQKAQIEFEKYLNQFDTEEENIHRKILHSYRVEEVSGKLAELIGLEEEQIKLAKLIGLLHDIGRFKQFTIYHTFEDHKSIDHGKLGVQILEKDQYIDCYVEEKYQNIIKKAIRNHNQYELEEGLTKEQKIYCNLIKDADKLDILYEATQIFWKGKEREIEKEEVSPAVFQIFKVNKLIPNEIKKGQLDYMIGMLSFVYDFNFKETYMILKEKEYISQILSRFQFKGSPNEGKINEIEKVINKYINQKTK
ncbi:MAG: HD domain-containing protein [Clostridia bacterium]